MNIRKTLSKKDLERCIDFHGHLCPGLAIGFQAARVLMDRLGVERSADEERVVTVETDACSADAIQVMTGCTFGKGNFICKNLGKHAFSLSDRGRGKTVRVCLRPGALPDDPKHLPLMERAHHGQATPEELALFHQLREEKLQNILDANPESLFTIEDIASEIPPQARIVDSELCDRCGEPTMVSSLRNIGGKKLCPSCAQTIPPGEIP